VEGPPGTFTDIAGINCFTSSEITGSAVQGTSTTQGDIYLNLPQSGRWLFCYQLSGTSTWVQVKQASTYGNPFYLIPTLMSFTVDTTAQSVTIRDLWTVSNVAQGSIASTDVVYLVNRTDVCGMAHSFNNANLGATGTQVALTNPSTTTAYLAVRGTPSTIAWLSSTTLASFKGFFKLCYYKSQEANSNSTTVANGQKPYVRANWYQLTNAG